MQKDIRNYTVGFDVVSVNRIAGTVSVRPYTIIDGDRQDQPILELIAGDAYEVAYTKAVVFEDTIDVGNRSWTSKRKAGR